MSARYWPLGSGRRVTSGFGPRDGGFHSGTDFGRDGGSAGMTVYAIQAGTVIYAGAARGYGGPDPAGWLVIDSDDSEGAGVWEYGHIVRNPDIHVGSKVVAGQPIATINPDRHSNAGVDPHLHISRMPYAYNPGEKRDPLPELAGAAEPEGRHAQPQPPAPPVLPVQRTVQQIWTGDPTWLAEVLHAKRPPIRVRELPEWEQYGHGDYLDLWGVMVHHTGNSRETAESIRSGRSDLQGPLSNLHIAPDGTVSVVAAGVCWHAGAGQYPGIPTNNANYHLIGIECAWPTVHPDGSFDENERWPDAQIIAMRDTVAAILSRLGFGPERVIAHKEWAGKSQGKWDPGNLDMSWFRGEVGKSMRGEFDAPPPPPPAPPAPPPPPPADPLALALVRLDRLEARVARLEAR